MFICWLIYLQSIPYLSATPFIMTLGFVPVRLATPPQFAAYAIPSDKALHVRRYSGLSSPFSMFSSLSWKKVVWNKHQSLKSDLYLRYLIEDLITPHYWSCSSELCINFVVWILRHDFDQSNGMDFAVFLKIMKFTFSCHLGNVIFSDLKGQSVNTPEIRSDTWNFGLIGQYN